MINKIVFYVSTALFVGLLIGYIITKSGQSNTVSQSVEKNDNFQNQAQTAQPNRANCLADDCLLVEDLEYPAGELSAEVQKALNAAIDDEYKALSTYESVIAKFGNIRPFSMIKGAEEQHIASLKAIYDKYDLEILGNSWLKKSSSPDTLKEACQIGVDAEIANAALYRNKLLPAVQEHEDIVLVFTNLMNASEQKHLPSFEKCN